MQIEPSLLPFMHLRFPTHRERHRRPLLIGDEALFEVEIISEPVEMPLSFRVSEHSVVTEEGVACGGRIHADVDGAGRRGEHPDTLGPELDEGTERGAEIPWCGGAIGTDAFEGPCRREGVSGRDEQERKGGGSVS